MKKNLIMLLVLLSVLVCATAASARNFVKVFENKNFGIWQVDADSIKDHGDYYTVWTKLAPKGEFFTKLAVMARPIGYIVNQMAITKDGNQSRILSETDYDVNGTAVAEGGSHQWQYIEDGSIYEKIYKFIRSRH